MQQKHPQATGLRIVNAIRGLGLKVDLLMEGLIKPPSKHTCCNNTLLDFRLALKVAQDDKLVDTDMLMDAADIFCNNKVAVGFLEHGTSELCLHYLIQEQDRIHAKAAHGVGGHRMFGVPMGVNVSHGTFDTIGTTQNGHGQAGFGQFMGTFMI
ncbi:hypothetical protein M427DRAFT_42976 [Gonapodya prolifera JEL478]|uniref:Uncharacterized protein n=1 Tax=Gonapodya prolifera (strain JEL478) TaxID=1344416 RepID=A0A139ALF8_GONPJ|nr:hypothetical protein M427DRAFT_42976 [Gonapodya prolifera JEL478]|eukprot:KXS17609.1 hypothetical protein M427DRAFT_42976 [Gonapodya prolifera JEL478]